MYTVVNLRRALKFLPINSGTILELLVFLALIVSIHGYFQVELPLAPLIVFSVSLWLCCLSIKGYAVFCLIRKCRHEIAYIWDSLPVDDRRKFIARILGVEMEADQKNLSDIDNLHLSDANPRNYVDLRNFLMVTGIPYKLVESKHDTTKFFY